MCAAVQHMKFLHGLHIHSLPFQCPGLISELIFRIVKLFREIMSNTKKYVDMKADILNSLHIRAHVSLQQMSLNSGSYYGFDSWRCICELMVAEV